MEEKVKLIIERLEHLKETQIREDKENNEEIESNQATIANLEREGKRLHSMRDAFEPEEEEYQDLSEEIAQTEAQIKELQSKNGELRTKGTEIRGNKAYTKQLDKIEEEKEELRKELKEKQRGFISSRKKIQPRLAEIEKEQARLQMDMDAIKRGITIEEKRVLKQNPLNQTTQVLDFKKHQLAKLVAKYQENEKEQKYLSEIDIYAELDKITAMLEQIDRLTFTDIKNGKTINLSVFQEKKQEEPVVEEQIEVETPIEQVEEVTPTKEEPEVEQDNIEKRKLAATRVLETQYGILKGDFLYDAVMKQIEMGGKVGDIHEFARNELNAMRTLNSVVEIEGTYDKLILQLEEEMDRLGIEYPKDEQEEEKKRLEEEARKKKEQEEEEKKRLEEEARKKKEQEEKERRRQEEEARKKKAEQLLKEAEEEKQKEAEEEKRRQEEEKRRKREEIIAKRRQEMSESKDKLAQIKIGSTMEYRLKGNGNVISGPYNKFEAQAGKNEINFNMNYMQQALTKGRELLRDMNLNISEEFEDRLDPVVVNTLITMDREYATQGKYLGEYLEFVATRGRTPMSFTIQYDLEQLEGKGIKAITNKFDKQRQEVLANARKYVEMSKYYDGNMVTVKEKKSIMSKIARMFKKKEEIKELPVLPEEIRACKGMDAYRIDNAVGEHNFRKALEYKVSKNMSIKSKIIQDAKFNMRDVEEVEEDIEEEIK